MPRAAAAAELTANDLVADPQRGVEQPERFDHAALRGAQPWQRRAKSTARAACWARRRVDALELEQAAARRRLRNIARPRVEDSPRPRRSREVDTARFEHEHRLTRAAARGGEDARAAARRIVSSAAARCRARRRPRGPARRGRGGLLRLLAAAAAWIRGPSMRAAISRSMAGETTAPRGVYGRSQLRSRGLSTSIVARRGRAARQTVT